MSWMIYRHIKTLIQTSKTSPQTLHLLHCFLLKTSLDHHEYFFSQLILSAATVSLRHARRLFDTSPIAPPPLFAWNTLIRAYSNNSAPTESIKLFSELLSGELKPDNFTYPFVIKACGRGSMLGVGGSVHSMVLKVGFGSEFHVRNTLLTMYAGCGVVEFARRVFDEMPERDVVSWTSMIAAYVNWYSDLPDLMEAPMETLEKRMEKLKKGQEKLLDEVAGLRAGVVNLQEMLRHLVRDKGVANQLAKLEFPSFRGDNPSSWISQAERYFRLDNTPEDMKVELALIAMEGAALHWLQWLMGRFPDLGWRKFTVELLRRYGDDFWRTPFEALAATHQTGSADEYVDLFISRMAAVTDLSDAHALGLFLNGLGEDIRLRIRLKDAEEICSTMHLAREIERELAATHMSYL